MIIRTGLGSIEAVIMTKKGGLVEFDLQAQSPVCATCYVASEAKAVLPPSNSSISGTLAHCANCCQEYEVRYRIVELQVPHSVVISIDGITVVRHTIASTSAEGMQSHITATGRRYLFK